MRRTALVAGLLGWVLACGCTSPESTRGRGTGPGADPGNRGPVVEMHEGSWMFHRTPRKIGAGHPDLEPARQAQRLTERGAQPSAQPSE